MFTRQELIEQPPHTSVTSDLLNRTTLMSVKVIFHSSSIDLYSLCHISSGYIISPLLGQSSSLLMKASCCEVETSLDRLLLVVSNHLTSRATTYSSCHTALRVTTYSILYTKGMAKVLSKR